MKVVVRRHQFDYHVFRVTAVAQAILAELNARHPDQKHQVFIECFEIHRPALALTPSILWKNPHLPFEVSERVVEARGEKVTRAGGKIYDLVIDLEGDGPFEARWMRTGLTFWSWVTQIAADALAPADLKTLPTFPRIEAVTTFGTSRPAGPYVILAPVSEQADPRHINVESLEAHARAKFPEAKILWVSPGNMQLGPSRTLAPWQSYPELAGILAGAEAVFAVNGIVAAMAQATFDGKPLAREFWYVRGLIPGQIKGESPHDVFSKMRTMIDTEPSTGVLSVDPANKMAVRVAVS
jgi:hypothetical protein